MVLVRTNTYRHTRKKEEINRASICILFLFHEQSMIVCLSRLGQWHRLALPLLYDVITHCIFIVSAVDLLAVLYSLNTTILQLCGNRADLRFFLLCLPRISANPQRIRISLCWSLISDWWLIDNLLIRAVRGRSTPDVTTFADPLILSRYIRTACTVSRLRPD